MILLDPLSLSTLGTYPLPFLSDFSRLVEGHLEHDHSTTSETATLRQSETSPVAVSEKSRVHLKTHGTSTATSAHHTPVNPPIGDVRQSGSAVFKVGGYCVGNALLNVFSNIHSMLSIQGD